MSPCACGRGCRGSPARLATPRYSWRPVQDLGGRGAARHRRRPILPVRCISTRASSTASTTFPEPASRFRTASSCRRSGPPDMKLPMLVTLRAGNTVDGPYRAQNDLVKHAEQRGYIVVTPMGYRPLRQPYYGSTYQIARPNAAAPAAGWTPEENERAEQDVLYVIDLVAKEYNADPSRILSSRAEPVGVRRASPCRQVSRQVCRARRELGSDRLRSRIRSTGSRGRWPCSGHPRRPGHGQPDRRRRKGWPRPRQAAGVDAVYATVPGGTHLEAYLTHAPQIFDFLDKRAKKP